MLVNKMPPTNSLWRGFPAIKGVRWFNLMVLLVTPAIAIRGLVVAPIPRSTLLFSVVYYIFSMLGEPRGSASNPALLTRQLQA